MKIKLLNDRAQIPSRGSDDAAGYDIYAANICAVDIAPGTCEKIPTGIATEIPNGYYVAIFPRSGAATKRGLRLANCVGVIDSDYRGEWFIPIYNDSDKIQRIYAGDRIAQAILMKYETTDFEVSVELSETERNDGGFGHSGR